MFGACAVELGFTRREVEEHTLRDLYAMLDAAGERNKSREREEWRRSLIVTQAAMNIMAKKPRPLTYLADQMLREAGGPVLPMPIDEYRAMIKEAHEKAMAKAGAQA